MKRKPRSFRKAGGIITSLNNYPNLSQLSARTNGPNDCVPTSLIDGLDYLTGKQFDIDAMVTAVYGPNYHGFTSARAFVPYCEAQGVKLFPIDGDNASLVQAMHQQIQHGFPCLLTEPDPYAPLHPDWSHVLSVYREDPGSLTARDPYSTHDVTHTDAEWAGLLEFREVWAMERIQEENMQIDISNPAVATYYKALNDHQWQCIQTGKILQYGVLSAYKTWGNSALCGLTYLGLVLSNEYAIDAVKYPGVVIVFFERGVLIYDPKHLLDNPPGAGSVYAAHLYSGPGQDPRLATAWQQIQQLQAQLGAQPPSQDPQAGQALVDMQQIKAIAGKY